ncbi:hypothetical protein ThrDRAFT_03673 [Frankia casuarinae]|uniref:Uncharacterized protein n=1 Tax=Frankia casuarinae (strain DSM 45818 / CECT 9043 / HFP020203 / CcI3) TaxID=106370 RepID=Q2JCA2_FRACC|nr:MULTISPECIES: hypothetical protein [Frankia]ABD11090.1 hypothetical protein Francci3_1714 [Frankia casuarinae]EYT90677.1 hypothetical protein ThrDRAFT_03673 [Frankia casuarinae]OFB39732.1 hypothetical protein Manayef4_20205 [Frankia sp. CgIM4]
MGRTAGRRTSRTAADLDALRRRPVNPGGPPTDDDRLDARALLAALTGGDGGRHTALRAAYLGDHTAPSYDPDRVVRILTALRDQLADEIETWTYHRISRARAEEIRRHHLERDDCSGCVDPCAFCVTWADALGLERVADAGRHVWRPRPRAEARPRPAARRRRAGRVAEPSSERSDGDGS